MFTFGRNSVCNTILVCDAPDPAEQVISYIVYQDGIEIARPDAESDGSLRMDLQDTTPGFMNGLQEE